MSSITVLNVAEKPSVAKEIASIISNGNCTKRTGRERYCPIWDFDADVPSLGGKVKMKFTSVLGHLFQIDFDTRFKNWNGCNALDLFEAPIVSSLLEDKTNLAKQLQSEVREASILVLWLDCDREGERIAFEVIEACKLSSRTKRIIIKRARFSSVAAPDIRQALESLVEPDVKLSLAVEARSELDLRIGSAFTRLLTRTLQPKFQELAAGKKLISYGPCQMPTLAFAVERYNEIQNFEPKTFYELRLYYRPLPSSRHYAFLKQNQRRSAGTHPENNDEDEEEDDSSAGPNRAPRVRVSYSPISSNTVQRNTCEMVFTSNRGRIFEEAEMQPLFLSLQSIQRALVVSCQSSPVTKEKPTPMNSVDLAKLASRCLRISSQEAASIAEKLYQQGYISYPRTETQSFDAAIDLKALVTVHESHPLWGRHASRLLMNDGNFAPPRAGGKHDRAHPPIHPLKPAVESQFSERLGGRNGWRIYELIARHFLACCSKDALGLASSVKVRLASEEFSAKGLQILERNFLDVYPYIPWSDSTIPVFSIGETIEPVSLQLHTGTTIPPLLLTEHELVAKMDESGIGTDATIPEHIAKVLEREYMFRQDSDGRFTPSTLGFCLFSALERLELFDLSRPHQRALMEADLAQICAGTKTKEDVVRGAIQKAIPSFVKLSRNMDVVVRTLAQYLTKVGSDSALVPGRQNISVCGKCQSQSISLMRTSGATTGGSLYSLTCTVCSSSYETLQGTRDVLPFLVTNPASHTQTQTLCPVCQFGVVKVQREIDSHSSSSEDRFEWINVCVYCSNHPPADLFPASTAPLPACSRCTHASCPVATSQRSVGAEERRKRTALFPCSLGRCSGYVQITGDAARGFHLHCDQPSCPHTISCSNDVIVAKISSPKQPCPRCCDPLTGLIVNQATFTLRGHSQRTSTRSTSDPDVIVIDLDPAPATFTVECCVVCNMQQLVSLGFGTEQPRTISSQERKETVRQSRRIEGGVADVEDAGTTVTIAHGLAPGIQRPGTNAQLRPGTSTPASTSAASNGSTGGPLCKGHSFPTKKATAKASKREFWCCSLPQAEGGCGFNGWTEDAVATALPPPSSANSVAPFVPAPQRDLVRAYSYQPDEFKAVQVPFAPAPSSSSSSSSTGITPTASICFSCKQPGHFAFSCPRSINGASANTSRGAQQTCFKCHKPGHLASTCSVFDPANSVSTSGRSSGRNNAGTTPGSSRKSPGTNKRPEESATGESSASKRSRVAQPRKCSKCGQPGHTKVTCVA
jgi:DNA topoisomerase III